jgi:NADPH:quinone reductase-like Zn-dependent oxidoreductase
VQIAKARGAHVIATASAGKHGFLRGLGADEVVDYRAADFTGTVDPVDIVIDTVGGDTPFRSLTVLRPGGILVTAVDKGNEELAKAAAAVDVRFAGISVEPDVVGLEALNALVEAGRLRPFVEQAFELADAAKAHEVVAGGHVQGKVVLTV